jgi:hypothetical protein
LLEAEDYEIFLELAMCTQTSANLRHQLLDNIIDANDSNLKLSENRQYEDEGEIAEFFYNNTQDLDDEDDFIVDEN